MASLDCHSEGSAVASGKRLKRPLHGVRITFMPPEKLHWSHLYQEVVTSGLCTGCSACVVVCPYDVLGYNDQDGVYRPFHVPEMGGTDNCTHGEKGCTLCTRACPRFGSWEPEVDTFLFGREREESEVYGDRKHTSELQSLRHLV